MGVWQTSETEAAVWARCAASGRGCAWRGIDCWAQTVTHMTCVMWASPYYSALCGAATLSSVTMKCKAAVAKRANYKDGQSTYAPQSWQLDISIHHSESMWEERAEKRGEEREEKQNAVFNHRVVSCADSCCVFVPGLLVWLMTVRHWHKR